jgi:hypothetical protein
LRILKVVTGQVKIMKKQKGNKRKIHKELQLQSWHTARRRR